MAPSLIPFRVLVEAGAGSCVDLTAYDRLYPGLPAGLPEIHHAEHDTVVGDSHGIHAQLHSPVYERLQARGPVQQAVFGMYV